MLSLLLATAMAAGANASAWRESLDWHGAHVGISADAQHGYMLVGPYGRRAIPAQSLRTETASVLFDGLFALAQDELKQDSVASIKDDAFDHGQPIACACFETGAKWHYVWTRDLSFSVDLGLWRYDPARAKASLRFKLSGVRAKDVPNGSDSRQIYPMQDTGSGGSWPISTDRIVWFLAARHLLDDHAFADETWRALNDTLAQDRAYAFDAGMGLYRGETSFLDWREQSYPAWTANDVTFIAQSYALSTNVLHYEALRLAARMAHERHDARAVEYTAEADELKAAINARFWRADRGLYMSYVGGDGLPVEAYDLLGTALAITSGVAEGDRARQALANYPAWPAGSPVIWPERADQPIYHNRAIWPFVSAYALRAARVTRQPARIAHELRSLLRGAALAGSNMENFELATQATHVEDGKLSGPVVDSPRQLWSVAGYLDMVSEGVFGLGDDGSVHPMLPTALVPMLFGTRERISLQLQDRRITLVRPVALHGNLLVAERTTHDGADTVVTLKAVQVPDTPLRTDAPLYAPPTPAAPSVTRDGSHWQVRSAARGALYVDGHRHGASGTAWTLPGSSAHTCFRVTAIAGDGLESLPSPATCVGDEAQVTGAWPRAWTAPTSDRYRVALDYANGHGPINTGITAAVKWLAVQCAGTAPQRVPLVLPHSVGVQSSTYGMIAATAGARCTFALEQGFNMSDLAHFAHYTGGAGGSAGPLNDATIGTLRIAPLAAETTRP